MIRVYSPEGSREHKSLALAAVRDARAADFRLAVLDNGKDNALQLMTAIAECIAAEQNWPEPVVIRKVHSSEPVRPETVGSLCRNADLVLTGTAD